MSSLESETKDYLKSKLIEARKEILVTKNSSQVIIDLLDLSAKYPDNNEISITLALAYFENRNYTEASRIFQELNEKCQAAYCELFLGNEKKARKLWFEAPDSEASNWGRCLVDLVNLKIKQFPTCLQLRNHLECDIGYFIQSGKLVYAENLVQCGEFFVSINPESYKFIGRSLLHNGFPNLAVKFLIKSQKLIPQDPEIYYHLGQYSYTVQAYQECKEVLKKCLELNKHYSPARDLLEKIKMKFGDK